MDEQLLNTTSHLGGNDGRLNHKPQTPYTNPAAAKSCHMELTKDKAGNEECFDAEPDCKERCKPGVPVSWRTNQKKANSKNPEANVGQELILKQIKTKFELLLSLAQCSLILLVL